MFSRLIICVLASTFIVSCADRRREEETAALLDRVEEQLGTLQVQQAELYDTADFLEAQGAMLRERSDELSIALADIEDAIERVRIANDLPRDAGGSAPVPSDQPSAEPATDNTTAAPSSPARPDRRDANLGTLLFWGIVVGAGVFFYRRRRARSAEEEAWKTATYAPQEPQPPADDHRGMSDH